MFKRTFNIRHVENINFYLFYLFLDAWFWSWLDFSDRNSKSQVRSAILADVAICLMPIGAAAAAVFVIIVIIVGKEK